MFKTNYNQKCYLVRNQIARNARNNWCGRVFSISDVQCNYSKKKLKYYKKNKITFFSDSSRDSH